MIQVEGELDMNTATELERQLEAPLAAPRLDLADRPQPLRIHRLDRDRPDRPGLAGAPATASRSAGSGDQVKRVLDVTGLEATIPTHPSRDEALARLRA